MNLCTVQFKEPGKGLGNAQTMKNFNLYIVGFLKKQTLNLYIYIKGPHKWNQMALSNCFLGLLIISATWNQREKKRTIFKLKDISLHLQSNHYLELAKCSCLQSLSTEVEN